MKLPDPVPPVIEAALKGCTEGERELLALRLMGPADERATAEYLSDVLTAWGYPVSATTIRTYRRLAKRASA